MPCAGYPATVIRRPFKPWLYRHALNCYRDRYKRREFRQVVRRSTSAGRIRRSDPGYRSKINRNAEDAERLLVYLQQLPYRSANDAAALARALVSGDCRDPEVP